MEVSGDLDPGGRYWPYSLLRAVDSLVRLARWHEAHALLDELSRRLPEASANLRCHALAMRGLLHLEEGRTDLAAEAIDAARALVPEVRELGWAGQTIRYVQARHVALALARSQHDDVGRLVETYVQDDVYAEAPLDLAALLLDLASSQEELEHADLARSPRTRATLDRLLDLLEPQGASAERDRLLARTELALARIHLAAEEPELAAGRLRSAEARLAARAGAGSKEVAEAHRLRAALALFLGDEDQLVDARKALAESFDQRVAWLGRLPERPGGLGLLHYRETRAALCELIRLDLAIEGPRAGTARGLDRVLEIQALTTLARRFDAPMPTLAEIRAELLSEGHGLLVYLPVSRRSLVLALDASEARFFELAGMNDILEANERHMLALLTPLPAPPGAREAALGRERAAAKELSELLLPPPVAERVLRWDAVTFVGLDSIGAIGLGWLPLGEEQHMGSAKAWAVLPSIPYGMARIRPASGPAASLEAEFLLVGGVRPSPELMTTHPELEPLPLTRSVERDLVAAYRNATVLEAGAATGHSVLAQVRHHAVVQLLVHAIHDSSRARPTGLVLEAGPDDRAGVLWTEDVGGEHPRTGHPGLVLVTACSSGRSPLRRGDAGGADLGGAWLAAGAGAVLVSHSDLTWGATVELSEAFHSHLRAEGCAPAEALRRALADQRVDDPRELPFRYGVLEVVGLGHVPIFDAPLERRDLSVVLVGVAIAVLLGSAVVVARRAA